MKGDHAHQDDQRGRDVPLGIRHARGLLEGQGQIGVAFAQGSNPPEFKALFLIDIDPPRHKSPEAPPTFDGSINVGRYGDDGKDVAVSLKAVSYRLTPATRCPPP